MAVKCSLSQTARELLRDDPDTGRLSLRDLGEHRLKDLTSPSGSTSLSRRDFSESFPELKTAAPPLRSKAARGELAEAAAEEIRQKAGDGQAAES